MYILRIEHLVPEYERWKRAFDSDPVGRREHGVLRHRVLRSIDDPNYVLIELEFGTTSEAEGLLEAMRKVWKRVEGSVMTGPNAKIFEAVETEDY